MDVSVFMVLGSGVVIRTEVVANAVIPASDMLDQLGREYLGKSEYDELKGDRKHLFGFVEELNEKLSNKKIQILWSENIDVRMSLFTEEDSLRDKFQSRFGSHYEPDNAEDDDEPITFDVLKELCRDEWSTDVTLQEKFSHDLDLLEYLIINLDWTYPSTYIEELKNFD